VVGSCLYNSPVIFNRQSNSDTHYQLLIFIKQIKQTNSIYSSSLKTQQTNNVSIDKENLTEQQKLRLFFTSKGCVSSSMRVSLLP
jgi:hypothetical protein